MRTYSKYKQGFFNPQNPIKYKGSKPIIYRSGLELKFMRWADWNSNILEWGSESVIIPYIKPILDATKTPKIHRYYVDFNLTLKTNNGTEKYLIEVKPQRQTQPPKPRKNTKPASLLREQYTFAVNDAKWKAAQQWCQKNGYKFKIITENDLPKT